MASPAALLFQQACGLQDLQMLRYRRPAHRQLTGELSDGRRPPAQQVNHVLAGGVGEGAQHLQSVSHTLR